jgi:hypothetical protein
MPKLLLKARPVRAQLRDRLRAPLPDGLELYLDESDVADQGAIDGVVETLESLRPPADFTLLIEGPVRSLDGTYFRTSRNAEPDRELVRRLVALGRRIRARAVNLHLILPRPGCGQLSLERRTAELRRCVPFVRFYVEAVRGAQMIPTLENMPLVLRMREGGFYSSVVGMPAEDLAWLAGQVPGLRVCLDVSHAQLYVNACLAAQRARPPQGFIRLLRFVRQLPQVASVAEYGERLGDLVITSHIANAAGLLGEGRSYARGDLDLDALVPILARRAAFLVTETLERRPERATLMREALRRMREAVGCEGTPDSARA